MNLFYDLQLKFYFMDYEPTGCKNRSSISTGKGLGASLKNRGI